MPEIIVHIGYHKTGTTYLQKKIYPNIQNLKYYDYLSENLFPGMSSKSSFDVDLDRINEKLNSLGHDRILYSQEGLVGPLFYNSGINAKEIADNLKKLNVSKIIITLRNQVSLIDSIYRQYIQEGGVARFNHFIKGWRYSFDLDHLNFYRLINYYSSLFGKENVLIILSEQIRENEAEVIRQLENFTNGTYIENNKNLNPRQSNISLSNLSIILLRFINHFTYSNHRPSCAILPNNFTTWKIRYALQRLIDPYLFSRISGRKLLINKKTIDFLSGHYRANNVKLQKEYDLDIARYGYPL